MTDFPHILEQARDASADAAFAHLAAHGDRADCGGAWVVVPARTPFARWAKAQGITHRHHAGGYAIHVCDALHAQSRVIYERACHAFAGVLRQAGIAATVYSYAD